MRELTRRGAALLAAGGVVGLARCTAVARTAPVRASSSAAAASSSPAKATASAFDRSAYSIEADASLWVVVNKVRPFRASFTPATTVVPVPHTNPPLLRQAGSRAVVTIFAASRDAGVPLASDSTYRPFADQQSVHDGNLSTLGTARADRLTAHHIGAASGRCSLDTCMGELPEGRWLAEHAWKYEFLLRYPEDQVAVTGYQYEPWHFRYLGTSLATELHRTGIPTRRARLRLTAVCGRGHCRPTGVQASSQD